MQSLKYLAAIPVIAAVAAAPANAALHAAPNAASKAPNGADFVRQAPLPSWAVAPLRVSASDKTDPVVELVHETQISLGSTTAVLHNLAVQVNDQSALAGIGQYALSYLPAYQRLLIHRVAIVRKGEVIDHTASVSIRALEREEGLEKGVYGGTKTMQMLLRDVRVGDALWVTYTVEGENPVFGGKFSRVAGWDGDTPVEQRRLIVTHPNKRPITWAQLGDFNPVKLEPRVEKVGDNIRLTFEGKGLAAVEGEASMPAEYVPGRLLQFSEFPDWHAVAQWASGLFDTPRSSPALVALAESLGKGGTQMERATAALRWVQDEVRYFSVSIGENSHRPQLPEVVLRNRYGDCKDKSRLLVALLGQMGIQAKPVLVSAFAPRIAPRVQPSPFWFDHVIVRLTLDGQEYFVDPTQTGQREAIADLPPALAGGSGLVVDSGTAALVAIPTDRSDLPQFELNETIAAPELGGAGTLLAKRYYRGALAAWARRHFSSLSQPLQRKWALELYEKQYPGVTLLDPPVVADDGGRFVMTAHYSLPKPITLEDEVYRISYETRVMDDTLDIPPKIARNYPFAPAYGKYHSRYRLTMEWPKALRINNLPAAHQVDSPHLQGHEYYISRGNFVDYELDYRIKEDRIPAADMPALLETSKKLRDFTSGAFRVRAEQMSPATAAGYSYRNLGLVGSWDGVRQLGKNVLGKKADQISLSDACDYAADFYVIEDALPERGYGEGRALRSLLLSKKGEPKAIECVPHALLLATDGEGALAAIGGEALAADSPQLAELVTARWMSGDLAGAATDMERYYKARVAAGQVNGFDTLRMLTLLQRAGRPVPEELLARAKADPLGPWPLPLLAMQAGALPAAQVEAIARALPRDASDMALNDYWLQVGEVALVKGDQAAARHAFAWFKANGIRTFTPHLLARAEAARLVEVQPDVEAATQLIGAGKAADGLRMLLNAADQGSRAAQYELALLYREGKSAPKDDVKSAQLLKAAALQGHAAACNELGRAYGLGLGVPVDEKIAVEWYAKGADLGDRAAIHNLASRYRLGLHVPKDPVKAASLMRDSAEMGNAEAQARLAAFYRRGFGLEVDNEQARYWAARSVQQNEALGYYELGMLLMDGLAVKKDPAAAAKMIRMAADDGVDDAQMKIGWMYETGDVVEKDWKTAVKYYQLAAAQGNGSGMASLGFMYRNGRGVAADAAAARMWFEKASHLGVPRATHWLALMYFSGEGGEKDAAHAVELLKPNAETYEDSAYALGASYHYGTGVKADPARAVEYYQIAAKHEHGTAINNLGDMYENGLGVEQSYPKAIELYKRAALLQTGIAFGSLSDLLEKGKGLQKDLQLSYTYALLSKRFYYRDAAKAVDSLAKQLTAEQMKAAEAVATAWTVKDPLPGFSEASASPAGRE